MKNLINIIKWTVYSMIVYIIGDYFYTDPSFNTEYIVKLLVAFSVYLIAFGVYFTLRGE